MQKKKLMYPAIAAVLLLVIVLAGCTTTEEMDNEKAPSFNLKTYDGQTVSLEGYKGKSLILLFSGSWCAACREEAPTIDKVYKDYKFKVNFLSINGNDTVEGIKSFVKELKVSYPIALGNEGNFQDYRVTSIPNFFFIDKEGNITGKHLGPLSEEELRAKFEELSR